MSEIHRSGGPSIQPLRQGSDTPSIGSDKGKIGGREVGKDVGVKLEAPPPKSQDGIKDLSQRKVDKDKGPVNLGLRSEARYRALPSREQLIAKAGKPKGDINFLFIHKKMSTGYKAILGGLDTYNNALKSDGKVGKDQVQQLQQHLNTLKTASMDYQTGSSHSRKSEMRDLAHQLSNEEQLLDKVTWELNQGATWPDGVSLKDGLQFIRQGVSVDDLAATMAQDQENSGMKPEELQPYREAGFTGSEARLLKESGQGLEGGMKYREANLKVTPDTLVGEFNSGNEKGKLKSLGSGAFNTVYKGTYATSDGDKVGVFKPLPKVDASRVERGWVASRTGVNGRDPQLAMRNLGTVGVAKELGFGVVPNTRVGEHDGQLGLVMDLAPGNPGRQTDKALFKDPEVRQELTRLQLLDALVGQGDRHGNNYFINKDSITGQVTVTGIDNDQCFGKDLHDPNGIAKGNAPETRGFRGVKLPPVVDRATAQALRDLTPEKLDTLLGGKLSAEEISATKDRLTGIKQHLQQLETDGKLIDANQWGSDEVSNLLSFNNSYVGRDGYEPPRVANQTLLENLNMF